MRRIALVFVLIAYAGSGLFSQNPGPRDIILLLDTSVGMAAGTSYEEFSGYITRVFPREHLRIGDTFHLIPFSDKPFLDISRRITSRGDAETVIGRMFLHYPLYPRADIPAALAFAENYVSSLPERPKKIVLVSANGISAAAGLFEETRARLARQNTTLEFVQITPGRTAPAVTPSVVTPPVVTPQTVTPPVVTPAEQADPAEQAAPEAEDTFEFEHEPFIFEPFPDPTLYALEEDLNFAETVLPEQRPQEEPEVTPAPKPVRGFAVSFTTTILTLSGIFWLLALIIPLFFLAAVSRKMNFPKYAPAGTSGLLIMNLYVEDQSTYIGRRNIHALKPGYSYTVGGKDSDFLIFVVKVPPNIAKVRTDGKTVTFSPLLHRYFPTLGSVELKDCVGKTIRIISDKNYQLKIRFDVIETPIKPLS